MSNLKKYHCGHMHHMKDGLCIRLSQIPQGPDMRTSDMKMIEWGVIPTRSPKAKKDGTDGHLGFFTYESEGCVYQGEVKTPVLKDPAAARKMLKSIIEAFGFRMPDELL